MVFFFWKMEEKAINCVTDALCLMNSVFSPFGCRKWWLSTYACICRFFFSQYGSCIQMLAHFIYFPSFSFSPFTNLKTFHIRRRLCVWAVTKQFIFTLKSGIREWHYFSILRNDHHKMASRQCTEESLYGEVAWV